MKRIKAKTPAPLPAPIARTARFAEPQDRETPEGGACYLGVELRMPGAEKPEKWTFRGRQNEEPDEAMARMRTSPAYNAAEVVYAFNGTPNDTLRGMVNELDRQAKAVNGGDLSQMEAMLTAQAHTLDAIFTRLAKRAHLNMGEHFNAAETYMRLAFKAQSQCRATVESLGQLRNPAPVAFVKQANISAGHQQINNGTATNPGPSRAEEKEIPPNKLLENTHGERLDTGTASASGRVNQNVEAMGAIHRPTKRGRKGTG